ncbi:MAG: ERF family protein [Desulfobacterales bacterium]
MSKQELNNKLNDIQQKLKAPKGQFNTFAKFNYRSCEDILVAVKGLLGAATLTLSDSVKAVGDRVYVEATATLTHDGNSVSVTAFAREAATKKGMDDSQITGTASSYARKYALNGLFCIDDTKDADSMDNAPPANSGYAGDVVADIQSMKTKKDLEVLWNKLNSDQQKKHRNEVGVKAETLP